MRSNDPARPAYGQDAAAAGRVGDQLVAGKVMGLPGGRGSPIERPDRDPGQAACWIRALRPARLVASTASPPASARPAAKPPREARSQLGCPLGSGGAGAVGWAGVWLGMEKRSRASTRWRAASAAVCSGDATWPWRQGSPTWRSVASRRASFPSGSWLAWAWATAVMPARFIAASRAARMRARVSLDMVASDRSTDAVGVMAWLGGGGGPAATSHGPPWTDAGAPAGERHPPAAPGRPAGAVRSSVARPAPGSARHAGCSCPFPFVQLRLLVPVATVGRGLLLASSGWRRSVHPRIRHLPYANAHRFPIFGRWLLTAAVSLRPVRRDNPGEMGGRVASPTFVGRVEELELLEAARGRAADADPAVVLVGGEAGVGKTRLIAELTSRCARDGTRVLAGGCVPVGDGALPYAPIVEALRALVADLGASAVRDLVGPSWPELARLLPALGAPDRIGLSDQAAQARLFELLLGLLGRLGEQTPLVLVVEDLHWADRSTRDLLAFLVRNLRREQLLAVVSYRSDEPGQQRLGPYLAELDRASRVERIELLRLDQAQTEAQLVGILGAAPAAELVDAVFARSEGNPFFTEELLAAVQAGSRELPTTLRDLLRGRVQTLPQPAQHVLEVAAVAGRRMPHRLLAAVAGLHERQLDGALREAVTSQLLVTRPGEDGYDEDGYDVRHALVREVIDADLLPGERTRLHTALAHTVADLLGSGELDWPGSAAEVAVHWDRAGDRPNVLEWSVRAGVEAEDIYAYAEATHHY